MAAVAVAAVGCNNIDNFGRGAVSIMTRGPTNMCTIFGEYEYKNRGGNRTAKC